MSTHDGSARDDATIRQTLPALDAVRPNPHVELVDMIDTLGTDEARWLLELVRLLQVRP